MNTGAARAGEGARGSRATDGTAAVSLGSESLPVINTTGMVELALIAARIETSPLIAAMTSTLLWMRSAANAGSRSKLPSAQEYSTQKPKRENSADLGRVDCPGFFSMASAGT